MPSKRAKLSHPSPAHASVSSDEDEEVVDAVDADAKDPEAEVFEDVEEVPEQENDVTDEKHESTDNAEEEEEEDDDDDEEEEEDVEREVIEEIVEEEEEEEEEGQGEDEEAQEVQEQEGRGGQTERKDVEEDRVEADYEEADGSEEVERACDLNSGDEDAADVEDEAFDDEDKDVRDANEGEHSASEDLCDEDEDNGVEIKKLSTVENEDNADGDGGDDENDDDGDECRTEHVPKDGGVDSEEVAEAQHRKQLAMLMCFSSLQMLMAMELCRDTIPPHDEVCAEYSMLPGAFLKLMLLAVTSLMQEEGQRCGKLARPGHEWTHIARGVSSTDSATRDYIWRRKYSMSYPCFLYLVEELRPFIQSESQLYLSAPLEIERAVAMVLYRLAHGLNVRQVAEKYDVGASTVGKYTLIVASALAEANKLYGQYVAIPTGERIARIISEFQQITNVSNMCGAIDTAHIKLHLKREKLYSVSGYESSNKFQSIVVQAVCDANKIFWDVCCIASGGAHDAANFVSSSLYQNVKDGLSLQYPLLAFENKEIRPYMVGDGAYPMCSFLIRPFDTDDPLRRAFDEQLRKGLACINGAFAVLKTRWKVLKGMNVHPMHAPQIAVACCVLHNICQLWGEPEPPHQQKMETHSEEQSHRSAAAHEIDEAAKMAGEAAREAVFRDWVKRSL